MPQDYTATIQITDSEFAYIIKKLVEKANEDRYNNDHYLHNIIEKMERSKAYHAKMDTLKGYRG